MLHAGAQRQLKAVAQTAQIVGKRAVALHAGVGAPHQLFLGEAVVYGERVQINWGVAAIQSTEVNGLTLDSTGQQLLVHLGHQVKPGTSMGIQTLT